MRIVIPGIKARFGSRREIPRALTRCRDLHQRRRITLSGHNKRLDLFSSFGVFLQQSDFMSIIKPSVNDRFQ